MKLSKTKYEVGETESKLVGSLSIYRSYPKYVLYGKISYVKLQIYPSTLSLYYCYVLLPLRGLR